MSNALVVNTPNRPVPIIIVGGGGGGGGIVAGADTQVQFNDAGAFGGDTGLTYNKTTDSVKVGGLVVLGTLGDTALARSGVGVAEVNNGTMGTYRDLKVRNLQVQAGGRMTGAGAVPPAGTTGQHLMKNTGTDYDVSWQTPGATKIIWLTTPGSGTFTPDAGCRALYVELVGGGGGSAGALGTATPTAAISGGGGGGSFAAKYYATPAASYTYVVGAGGAAGAATPTVGGTGGDTTFGSPALTGFGAGGSAIPSAGSTPAASGAAGGSNGTALSSNGDVFILGGSGFHGIRLATATGVGGGSGGSSMFAGNSYGAANPNTAGQAGQSYGGGASGAASLNATGQAGAAGAPGAIKITEYF